MSDWSRYCAALAAISAELGGDAAARAAVLAAVVERVEPGLWGDRGNRRDRPAVPAPPADSVGPTLPGAVLEALMPPGLRRTGGVHHTPAGVARDLVGLAVARLAPAPTAGAARGVTVCDPAVGGGAFLLAAADRLHADGHDALAVHAGLHGCDIDPLATQASIVALRWWARDHGVDPGPDNPRLLVADGLAATRATWPGRGDGFDLVVGNPPFLSQLAGATARVEADRAVLRARFGDAVTGYVDAAGLFLLAAVDLARGGGVVCLVLPESILGSRDAGPVRAAVAAATDVTDVWVAGEHVFDATVRVCAPIVVVGSADRPPVRLWRGAAITRVPSRGERADRSDPWRGVVSAAYGTPVVDLEAGPTLGSLVSASAGFRDQFYGLAPHVREAPASAGDPPARLVTSGAIDPLWCRWGERPVRFAGRKWVRPVVDRDALGAADPGLLRWVDERLVPKVLLATQTKVLEAVVDTDGSLVPSVPVIAVIPRPAPDDGAALDSWAVAAVLLAPAVTAWALHHAGGTALAADAVKLAARQVAEVPLPCNADAWHEAAAALADGSADPETFAALMGAAYGLASNHPVHGWWLARLSSWRGVRRAG